MPEPETPTTGGTVRTTVDLTRDEHRQLRDRCNQYADDLDVTRITGRQVLRELLAELLTNKDLQQRIQDRLAATEVSR